MSRTGRASALFAGIGTAAAALAVLPHLAEAQRAGVAEQLPAGAPPAVQACVGCHGAQGEGNPEADAPRIAGQSQRYLLKQLESYVDGSRRSRVMEPIARGLPPEVRAGVARYYAQSLARVVASGDGGGEPPERGRELATRGDNALGVQACQNCHGPGGVGEPPNIPYIAGLDADYIAHELRAWKEGTRTNDAGQQMFTVVTALPEADMEAVAQYYASLPPPEPAPPDLVRGAPPPRPEVRVQRVVPAGPEPGERARTGPGLGGAGAAAVDEPDAAEPQAQERSPDASESQSERAQREGGVGVGQGPAVTGGTQGAGAPGASAVEDQDAAESEGQGGERAPSQSETGSEAVQREGRVGTGQGQATEGSTQGPGGTGESDVEDKDAQAQGGAQTGRGEGAQQPQEPQWPAVIDEPAQAEPQSFAPAAPGDPERGRTLVASGAYGCPACHAIPGIDWPRGIVGPPLENFGSRALIAGRLPNDPRTLAAFVFNAPAMVPDTGMPNVGLSFEEARHVAAYLRTLGTTNGG